MRFLPGSTRPYQKASFIGTVLDDVGLLRPPSQDVDDFALEIRAEQLAEADVIFTTHHGPADDTTQASSPRTRSGARSVQAGDGHAVADDHWMLGIGVGAARPRARRRRVLAARGATARSRASGRRSATLLVRLADHLDGSADQARGPGALLGEQLDPVSPSPSTYAAEYTVTVS